MIQRPRQRGPPLPKNLGQREAKVLIYATAELPFFGDFFETFPDGFPKILWVYDILGTFPNNLSKTACQNSYWFESYRTLKLADFLSFLFSFCGPSTPVRGLAHLRGPTPCSSSGAWTYWNKRAPFHTAGTQPPSPWSSPLPLQQSSRHHPHSHHSHSGVGRS